MMIIFLFFLLSSPVHAEYRVFLLGISDGQNERQVTTTLDDLQYPDYYHIKDTERVRYIDSWMCYGNTNELKRYCVKSGGENLPTQKTSSP